MGGGGSIALQKQMFAPELPEQSSWQYLHGYLLDFVQIQHFSLQFRSK